MKCITQNSHKITFSEKKYFHNLTHTKHLPGNDPWLVILISLLIILLLAITVPKSTSGSVSRVQDGINLQKGGKKKEKRHGYVLPKLENKFVFLRNLIKYDNGKSPTFLLVVLLMQLTLAL